jgi:outer membrane murein-binding lipoprotein Lpp
MNPTSILALISDLYAQVARLNEENTQLRAAAAAAQETAS